MTAPAHDDFTELRDADIPRVDLVGKAANGTRFLIAKAAQDGHLTAPLVPADMVRDLIAKADETKPADVAKADLDVTEPLATDAADADGSADMPGSPAWEAVDAATATKWAAILARAKNALELLACREEAEGDVGDTDDYSNAYDLGDAACAIDYAISLLAPYALGEQMEVELGGESPLEDVGKAAAALDPGALGVIEGLAPLRKAGRTLSAANETAIRDAVASLTKVLDSLPAAPAADDVTKTKETPAVTAPAPASDALARASFILGPTDGTDAVLAKAMARLPRLSDLQLAETLLAGGRAQEIAKAKGDPAMAVFDANGKLVGVIDPGDLQPIAETAPPADGDAQGGDDDTSEDGSDGDAAAAAPADDAAAPAAPADGDDSRVVPGTDTVQAPAQAPDDDQTPAVAKAADTQRLEETVASLTKQVENLVTDNDALKEQVRKFGLTPDDRRSPVLNGATGKPGAVARDQSAENPLADVLKTISEEPDPVKRDEMRKAAFFAVVPGAYDPAHAADVKARFRN